MALTAFDRPIQFDIKDPETGENFVMFDVSHPFTSDDDYMEFVQRFFRDNVMMSGF